METIETQQIGKFIIRYKKQDYGYEYFVIMHDSTDDMRVWTKSATRISTLKKFVASKIADLS